MKAILLFYYLVGCLQVTEADIPDIANQKAPKERSPPKRIFEKTSTAYGASIAVGDTSLLDAFPTPDGLSRIDIDKESFANWLRFLPVKDTRVVLAYNNQQISGAPAAAVVPLDVGRGDVQQCADSILRLCAEYLWERGDADRLGYHFTSGDLSTWASWKAGERFKIKGSTVSRVNSGLIDTSYENFQKWLRHTFLYAGTKSMSLDAQPVSVSDPIFPGDFFVAPGSPGHAVLVLDIAIGETGAFALLGQGFMPAQQFHILRSRNGVTWFRIPESDGYLSNPSWSGIPRTGAYRFSQN